jgi:hypothetical protein
MNNQLAFRPRSLVCTGVAEIRHWQELVWNLTSRTERYMVFALDITILVILYIYLKSRNLNDHPLLR